MNVRYPDQMNVPSVLDGTQTGSKQPRKPRLICLAHYQRNISGGTGKEPRLATDPCHLAMKKTGGRASFELFKLNRGRCPDDASFSVIPLLHLIQDRSFNFNDDMMVAS